MSTINSLRQFLTLSTPLPLLPGRGCQTVATIPARVLRREPTWSLTHEVNLPKLTQMSFLGSAKALKIKSGSDTSHSLFEILWNPQFSNLQKVTALFKRYRPYYVVPHNTLIFETLFPSSDSPVSPGDLLAISPSHRPNIAALPQQSQPSV